MYETPQYLTPGGYRRLAKNPYRKKLDEMQAKLIDDPAVAKKKKLLAARVLGTGKKRPQFELSDKAAMLIAQALKGMLKK